MLTSLRCRGIIILGGDTKLNKNDINKKRLTLRIDARINDEIERRAHEIGISKNNFISMVLHKEIKKSK